MGTTFNQNNKTTKRQTKTRPEAEKPIEPRYYKILQDTTRSVSSSAVCVLTLKKGDKVHLVY